MSEQTKIEWATSSWNPWLGCTKVSPGCLNCYAENSTPTRVARKNGKELWGKGKARQRTSASYWKQALAWNKQAGVRYQNSIAPLRPGYTQNPDYRYERPRVFPSLCDWLDDEVPIDWLADFLKLIHDTPNLDWLLLTKRPENWLPQVKDKVWDYMHGNPAYSSPLRQWMLDWLWNKIPPSNIWLGTSVEDQTRADERIPQLLKIPAAVRFLSVEPLLAPVNLDMCRHPQHHGAFPDAIHWVILGGESGPGARPCNVEWIRDLARQCQAAGVPCFVKQLGSEPRGWCKAFLNFDAKEVEDYCSSDYCDAYEANDSGSQCNRCLYLKHPKGGDPSEWPEDLRVRQFPLSHRGENAALTTR